MALGSVTHARRRPLWRDRTNENVPARRRQPLHSELRRSREYDGRGRSDDYVFGTSLTLAPGDSLILARKPSRGGVKEGGCRIDTAARATGTREEFLEGAKAFQSSIASVPGSAREGTRCSDIVCGLRLSLLPSFSSPPMAPPTTAGFRAGACATMPANGAAARGTASSFRASPCAWRWTVIICSRRRRCRLP